MLHLRTHNVSCSGCSSNVNLAREMRVFGSVSSLVLWAAWRFDAAQPLIMAECSCH